MISARMMIGATVAAFAASHAHADLVISNKASSEVSCVSGVCTATAAKAILNVNDLAGMLASGDVTVRSGSAAQDIDVDAALSSASTSRLTLDSYHSIAFNRPVSVRGTGAMTTTTNDGGSGGDYRFLGRGHIRFWDLTSNLIINGDHYRLLAHVRGIGKIGTFEALARSIDLQNTPYTSAPVRSCCGVFDGLGNTISHLTVNASGVGCGGLICNLKGTVRDLGVVSVHITVGDVAGVGAISNGGQLGAVIANSYATGQVSAGARGGAGGLIGGLEGTISHSYAAVTVIGGDDSEVGGLIGVAPGQDNFGTIDQSYATGTVSGGDGAIVGGLVGASTGAMISNSYAAGLVSGTSGASVGGLLGMNANRAGSGFVHGAYATGLVSGGSGALLGGLIGDDESSDSISNAYWDLDTTGVSNVHQGAGNVADDPGITGLSDAQLKSGLPGGFDKKIWKQNLSINNGYPYLLANPPQ